MAQAATSLTVEEARAKQEAARGELRRLQEQRERLPGLIADATAAGDFEAARSHRSVLADCEDRLSFQRLQVAMADQAVIDAEMADAKADVQQATTALEEAFLCETRHRLAWDDATSQLRRAQTALGAAQSRVQSLEARRRNLERRSDGKDEPA